MPFVLLHVAAAALERRYDGPIPRHGAFLPTGNGLLERLAAESRAQAARRRRRMSAAQAMADRVLDDRVLALALYRRQAMILDRGAGEAACIQT